MCILTDDSAWIPLFGVTEVSIGLIAGSLPFIGSLFHFFDAPKPNETGVVKMATRTIGGTPYHAGRRADVFFPLEDVGEGWASDTDTEAIVGTRGPAEKTSSTSEHRAGTKESSERQGMHRKSEGAVGYIITDPRYVV